jgi:hypothetical protein
VSAAPFRRRRDGRYVVKLDPGVRAVLATLSQQLLPTLETADPMTRRLFPPAYPDAGQARQEQEYRELVDEALVNHHRDAFAVLAETARSDILSESQFDAWLSAVGSMRLVIGTRLDVSEDMPEPAPDDPAAPEYALYELLGQLQFLMVEVLAAGLPPEGRPEGII